ncbi:cytoglobin-2-like [Ornithorhynchus anatinus]|uniref:cytoglobin-2-like n=1 Tax=Ornithorhynchus anatinus TaxID=9258 RepID=UPI0010A81995|nr:cytoglobin-2-like [Ornithorhynchus anatinus]
MGCALASPGGGPEVGVEPEPLSAEQKRLVRDSWAALHRDIGHIGVIVFIRLLETHPECKDAFFHFRDVADLEELRSSRELQAHGLRVMSFIEKTVARLGEPEQLRQLMWDLGQSHHRYGAPPRYYQYVEEQFLQAARDMLDQKWTEEVEAAWKSLFRYLVAVMKLGYAASEEGGED